MQTVKLTRILISRDINPNENGGAFFPVDIIPQGIELIAEMYDNDVCILPWCNRSTTIPSHSYHKLALEENELYMHYNPLSGPVVPDGYMNDFINNADKSSIIEVGSELMITGFRSFIVKHAKYNKINIYQHNVENGCLEVIVYKINEYGRYTKHAVPSLFDDYLDALLDL